METLIVTGLSAIPLAVIPTALMLLIGLFDGFPRLSIGQLAGVVALSAWGMAWFSPEFYVFANYYAIATVLGLLIIFFAAWRIEMKHMMSRRDDDFPGRHDKLIWALALTMFAPVGVWLYRDHRSGGAPEGGGRDPLAGPGI